MPQSFATKIVKYLAVVLALVLAGTPIAAQDLDKNSKQGLESETTDVLVLLWTPQDELSGPDAMAKPVWSYFIFWGAFAGPAGLVAGELLDEAGLSDEIGRDDSVWDALQSMHGDFDFESAVRDAIYEVEATSDWKIQALETGEYDSKNSRIAARIFRTADTEHILFVQTLYSLSPKLDQVRLRVTIKGYSHNPMFSYPPAHYDRTYEYLSPSHGIALRDFRDGEKEAMLMEVETVFAELAESDPDNAAAHDKNRKAALKFLRGRDVIPPGMALVEGWPGTTLQDELERATAHAVFMLQQDLKKFHSPLPDAGNYQWFDRINSIGDRNKIRGYVVSTLGPNTMYRDKRGNMYSVPDWSQEGGWATAD